MKGSLADVARSHSLRCDAKQGEERFRRFDAWIDSVPHFLLGDMLPLPIVKGAQPEYADTLDDGILVITTLAIQDLAINVDACRPASNVDFGEDNVRKPKPGDVLLTVDGGTSIGKPALFELDGDWAVDSHVVILRPKDLDPRYLIYLLASPLGQLQFQRAESGASGQTSVTEEDIRRFRFPVRAAPDEAKAIALIGAARGEAVRLRAEATKIEDNGWEDFLKAFAPGL
jgi:hypothetical protein